MIQLITRYATYIAHAMDIGLYTSLNTVSYSNSPSMPIVVLSIARAGVTKEWGSYQKISTLLRKQVAVI